MNVAQFAPRYGGLHQRSWMSNPTRSLTQIENRKIVNNVVRCPHLGVTYLEIMRIMVPEPGAIGTLYVETSGADLRTVQYSQYKDPIYVVHFVD